MKAQKAVKTDESHEGYEDHETHDKPCTDAKQKVRPESREMRVKDSGVV